MYMSIAIISDIHSNLEALQTTFEYIDQQNINRVFCLGDIVGYGADPNECIELVHDRCATVLMGNHDFAAANLLNLDYFNDFARTAAYWTSMALSDDNKNYLRNLPSIHQNDKWLMVHASPTTPSQWHYVLSHQEALIEMQAFSQSLCFIGHSHVPVIFSRENVTRNAVLRLNDNDQYIVNVGSVGQPRDGDPRLCFVVYDEEEHEMKFVRLEYDVQKTYDKIIQAGLPYFLAERLLRGY